MSVIVYAYAACGTCKKALTWLRARGVELDVRPIVETPPSAAQLRTWMKASGLPARKWFNTSGQSYRALTAERGKEAVSALGDGEVVALLAADGKLIKRPVVVVGDAALVGFDEAAYARAFPRRT